MLTVRHNQRGFSLIELAAAMAVVAVLMALGTPSFRTWIQNTQLRTASESISAGLQLARAEAVRLNTNVQFTLTGATLQDWTVGCVTPVGDLNGDGIADCPATIQSRSGTEGTPNAQVAANVTNVIFSGLGRANTAMTLNLTNSTGGTCMAAGGPMRCLNILVTTGGQVRMCNPNINRNTNPQGC